MPDAFTAGVRMGGLNDSAQIRILLCYLIDKLAPLPRPTLEGALLQEELVNYFELCSALADLENGGLVAAMPEGYVTSAKGSTVARELESDVPRSVRLKAAQAVERITAWKKKAAAHRAQVEHTEDGWAVSCGIRDGAGEIFSLRLAVPDAASAEAVKNRFIAHGGDIYAQLLELLTVPGVDDEPPAGAL